MATGERVCSSRAGGDCVCVGVFLVLREAIHGAAARERENSAGIDAATECRWRLEQKFDRISEFTGCVSC